MAVSENYSGYIPPLLTLHSQVNGLVWKVLLNILWLLVLRASLLVHVRRLLLVASWFPSSLLGLLVDG